MARKKRIIQKSRRKVATASVVKNHRTPLVVGTVVTVLTLILIGNAVSKKMVQPGLVLPTPVVLPTTIQNTNSMATSSATASQSAANASESPAVSTSSASSVVKKLPYTSSDNTMYVLRQGDSLARIGNRMCHDKRAWMYLEEDNNLVEPYTLHPGDAIVVNCR